MSSIRFLRSFVAVARSGSFSAASERVALTPTAVSLQMRALEDDLGCTLFDRTGKIVSLNERGHRMLPKAEALLQMYETLRNDDEGQQEVIGSISVGAVATSMSLLARAVLDLRASHPKLRIHLGINYSGDLSMRVKERELDAALAVKSAHRIPAGTSWTPLYTEPLVFVANRRSAGGRDTEALLRERLFLRPARNTHTGALIERFMRRRRLACNEFLEMNSMRTMIELVQQDVGVTIVPLQRTATWEKDRSLLIRHFDDPKAHRSIGLFENDARSHLTSVVRRRLLQELGEPPGA
ncbi:LysR family transcriptional regulator [Bordetella trematum]|uniref:LysR family transcriptional regulator n=1 Tax=Bordetella trematum TaxID=123899 RepID=UPI000D89F1AF|nr:LysR family transcriptional regulator [Bordetella trematum]SPU51405.1 LysR family transcriptional regulator [Bordetella trematum]VDH08673.1 HTH-type transcriptional activator CmpR [Bordetella trematum]